MVNFSIFNELSLPLNQHDANQKFIIFFKLLSSLKNKGLNQIRMSNSFKNYEILPHTSFVKFIGQQTDPDFKTRLKSFITNTIINIETPFIKESEEEQKTQLISCEYFYHQQSTKGGLACCDIWNTLAVSFESDEQWNKSHIIIFKDTIINDDIAKYEIQIKHASKLSHLNDHTIFFEDLEQEHKQNINQTNFWDEKESSFPNIIVFCPEVENQIKHLDSIVFKRAISILRDVETGRKLITDFNSSGESQTIKNNPELKILRTFTLNDEEIFFEQHVKSLPSGYRMYFLENNSKIHIGYIGKHLPT